MRIVLDTNVIIASDKDLVVLINHEQVKLGLSATFNSVVARRALPLHVRLNFLYIFN